MISAKEALGFVAAAGIGYAFVASAHSGLREIKLGGKLASERGLNVAGVDYIPLEDVAKFTQTQVEFDELMGKADLWPEPTGVELVKNGDFESGPSIELSMETPTEIPGWERKDGAAVMRLTGQSTGYIDGRKLKRQGKQFFSGGKGAEPSITQIIELKKYVSQFEGGKVGFVFHVDVGSFDDQNDGAIVNLTWLDAKSQRLGDVKIVGPDRGLRDYTSRFYRVFARAKVPAGTTSVKVEIEAIGDRTHGIWMDGWADNVSLKLDLPK